MMENGNDPFETVVSTFDRLTPGESFTLVVSFDPKPLIAFLSRRGAATRLLQNERGDVRYLITSGGSSGKNGNGVCPFINADGVMDLRHLDPPEPMVQILETLDKASSGTAVIAMLSRVPGHLVAMLERRGIPVNLEEKDGGFVITVTKP